MIQRNKQLNAADDLERARRMLESATLLLDHGHHEDAASNAYYAAHHAARALLFSLGLEVRSHEALRTLLAQHFERPGLLPRGTVKKLGDAFDARLQATYGVGVHFSRDQAAGWVAWSRRFVDTADGILAPRLAPASVREPRTSYRKTTPPPAVRKPAAKRRRNPTANSRRRPRTNSQSPSKQPAAKSQQR